jgi:hypothetical protein
LDYFADGHRGAAMIAAYYLCRREDLEPGAARMIGRRVDEIWSATPLFAPFPEESPDPALTGRITQALAASTDRLRQAGHNVIFPSLALKAMAEVPEAVTPSRVAGICRLIEAFTASDEPVAEGEVGVPGCEDLRTLAEFALAEALDTMERFDGRGQGWTGHLLTHTQAVVDLHLSGHADAARHARQGLALYVRRIRTGPGDGDRHIPEHPPADATPLTQRYWQARQASDIGLGHCLKYPYALYGLLDLAGGPHLRARCLEEAYRIL